MSSRGFETAIDRTLIDDLSRHRLLTGAEALELLMAVGAPPGAAAKAPKIAFDISELALSYAIDLYQERLPLPGAVREKAAALEHHCKCILALLGHDPSKPPVEEDLLQGLGGGGLFFAARLRGVDDGKASVHASIRGVYDLKLDARTLTRFISERAEPRQAAVMARKGRATKKGPRPKQAARRLVAGLAEVFREHWGREPGIISSKAAADVGELKGPFLVLLKTVADKLVARGLPLNNSKASLADYWRAVAAADRE